MPEKARLPVLVSVPHGGLLVPKKLREFCRLSLTDILVDGDTYSGDLYSVDEEVQSYHCFPIARAVLDLNRAPDDRPPCNPDGVVKTVTVSGHKVWKDPAGLKPVMIDYLLERYYYPYHRLLEESARSGSIELALDCHTMLARAPASAQKGLKRPLVCLSNGGDSRGEAVDRPVTAPPALLRDLAGIFEDSLKDIAAAHRVPAVLLNEPFKGGYITQKHGTLGKVPWLQVEFNRLLYLSGPPSKSCPDLETAARITVLRKIFIGTLKQLYM